MREYDTDYKETYNQEVYTPIIGEEDYSPPKVLSKYKKESIIFQETIQASPTNKCYFCNEDIDLFSSWRCKFCKHVFCGNHRLPEKHECHSLPPQNWNEYKKFQNMWNDV